MVNLHIPSTELQRGSHAARGVMARSDGRAPNASRWFLIDGDVAFSEQSFVYVRVV